MLGNRNSIDLRTSKLIDGEENRRPSAGPTASGSLGMLSRSSTVHFAAEFTDRPSATGYEYQSMPLQSTGTYRPEDDKYKGYQQLRASHAQRREKKGEEEMRHAEGGECSTWWHKQCDIGITAIDPHTNRCLPVWDLVVLVSVIAGCFILPYQVGFCWGEAQISSTILCERHLPRVVDIIFALDMLMQFITTRPHPYQKRWVWMPSEIALFYLKGQFWADLITVLPYHEVAVSLESTFGESYHFFNFLKIISLIRLQRIDVFIQRYEALVDLPFTWLKLVRLFLQLGLAVHWIACAWGSVFFFGRQMGSTSNWVASLREAKPALFDEADRETAMELYTASLYWSTMTITSIGYGDVNASNGLEAWCATLAMGICGILWAYIIGSICAIAAAFDENVREHEGTMDSLNQLTRTLDLPRDQRRKLREYFMMRKSLKWRSHQAQLVRAMSPQLQTAVLKALEDSYLGNMWFLKRVQSDGFLVHLFETFTYVMYPPQEPLQLTGSMVVLLSGLILRNARICPPGEVWGIEEILLDNPRLHVMYSAISLAYCDLQHLTKHSFSELLWHYPKERKRIRRLALKLAIGRAVTRKIVKPSWEFAKVSTVEEEKISEESEEPAYMIELKARVDALEVKLDRVLEVVEGIGAKLSHSSLKSDQKSTKSMGNTFMGKAWGSNISDSGTLVQSSSLARH